MLIEFGVKNFKSIRDRQALRLTAGNEQAHEETNVAQGDAISPRILKTAAIYGANAGGKSNLFGILEHVQRFIRFSASLNSGGTYTPFRFDLVSPSSPSEFDIVFLLDGVRYYYGFSILRSRVIEEWLYLYQGRKARALFRREADQQTGEDIYRFGSLLRGQKKLWEQTTKPDALFLSTAGEMGGEQLSGVYRWIVDAIVILGLSRDPDYFDSIKLLAREEDKKNILAFLNAADPTICDIEVQPGRKPAWIPAENPIMPLFVHETGAGSFAHFEFEEESAGTQRLFAYAAPVLRALGEGSVLIVDEFDVYLHTLLSRFLVNLFHSSENVRNAQLIFNTHDIGLLNTNLFRRDQIWFVDRDDRNSTVLYPLTDFEPHVDENIALSYLKGRYGAIPSFSNFKLHGV